MKALTLDPNIASRDNEKDLEKMASTSDNRYDRFQAAGRLAMGLILDSNATGGLDNLYVDIDPYSFRLHDDAEKRSSLGEYANGQFNCRGRLAISQELLQQPLLPL